MDYYLGDRCRQCGDCLAGCPVLKLKPSVAGDLVRRLAAGERIAAVLDRCTGCMSCDAICPEGAHPYGLLLERYHERYLASGIPRVFCNAMPQRPGPNLWRSMDRWLTVRERSDLELWSRPPSSQEVLFLGCNQRLTPYIAHTSLFKDIEIFTDPGECCGEYFLRLGLFEEARSKAASLAARFEELGVRRVVTFCPACQNTISNLAPGILGVTFDVEVIGLVDWLADRIERGEIAVVRRASGRVTVQDPCHASGLGQQTVDGVRRLLELMGFEVVEMETSGCEAECCGLGASLARYRLGDVVRTGLHRARQARGTGAGLTCAWCNGCYMTMNLFRLVYPRMQPVYHLVELVQSATGETPERRMPARAIQHLASAFEAAARDGFRFGNVRV
ncbi:MAG: (Fe-S)-binding protein [Actinomycetota bacterium]